SHAEAEQKLSETFQDHVLYRAAFALTVWIDKLFDQNAALQNEPAAIKLATHAALASAKLAAALSDDDVDELGMTIAYLKRALKAITVSMEAGAQLLTEKLITPQQHSVLQQRLFEVRDGIISLMGQYRGEWLRRYGSLEGRLNELAAFPSNYAYGSDSGSGRCPGTRSGETLPEG